VFALKPALKREDPMLSRQQFERARTRVIELMGQVSIALSPDEMNRIEVADFGLDDLERIGLQLLTYINTERVCAKELVLFPTQTCPEHFHPPVDGEPGKEETFRCRWGEVYLYVPGPPTEKPMGHIPEGLREYFTMRHEVHLRPGDQYTILPETSHWFQAGPHGAVVSEFSTKSRDEYDVFRDPRIVRAPRVGDD
jgi:D-lyxose ketol-isomerase